MDIIAYMSNNETIAYIFRFDRKMTLFSNLEKNYLYFHKIFIWFEKTGIIIEIFIEEQ